MPQSFALDLSALVVTPGTDGPAYAEVWRVPALSTGVYAFADGQDDPQAPHGQDELYLGLAGTATLDVAGEVIAMRPGVLAYVAAGAPHRFVDARDGFRALVVFAPAEDDV